MSTTYDEIIDSRDLLKEIRDLIEDPSYDYNDAPDHVYDDGEQVYPAYFDLPGEDRERVDYLRNILRELPGETVDGRNSWGVTMVREDYFTQYAEELANDLGMIDSDATAGKWPLYCIDWKRAANDLKADYSEIEFDGATYLCRE